MQRELNQLNGTVMVLGRSGTGKTLCLNERMTRDRHIDAGGEATKRGGGDVQGSSATHNNNKSNNNSNNMTQLFVSRGRRLRELVRSLQIQSCCGERSHEEQLALTDFLTLEQFLVQMEIAAAVTAAVAAATAAAAKTETSLSTPPPFSWQSDKNVDITRFRNVLCPQPSISSGSSSKAGPLEPLVVWTQIRSFIKGSIEAALVGQPLSLEEYLGLARERCRLLPEQRREVYAVYTRYEREKVERGWWDDGDRVLALLSLSRLEPLRGAARSSSKGGGKLHNDDSDNEEEEKDGRDYDRVYIDEVQDYTQAELLVFILAAGMRYDTLFLAGDPAQAVVEGVDFRFEEVRSIFYLLHQRDQQRVPYVEQKKGGRGKKKGRGGGRGHSSSSDGRRSGGGSGAVIDKPTQLLHNYRSHSGILNCSSAVLDQLHLSFPGSAKVLSRETGRGTGPQPVFFQAERQEQLQELLLLAPMLVVLRPDEQQSQTGSEGSSSRGSDDQGTTTTTISTTDSNVLSLGIREAKGLEFDDVAIVNFFRHLDARDTKGWKHLLQPSEASSAAVSGDMAFQYLYTQLEGQLKVLYTAITRSCNRLVFIETVPSSIGTLFFAWLQRMQLAQPLPYPFSSEEGEGEEEAGGEAQEGSAFISSLRSVFNTPDEWRLRGVKAALSVESGVGEYSSSSGGGSGGGREDKLLSYAATCFEQASDVRLQERALAEQAVRRFASDRANAKRQREEAETKTDKKKNKKMKKMKNEEDEEKDGGSDDGDDDDGALAAALLTRALCSGVDEDAVRQFCESVGPRSCDPVRFNSEITERIRNQEPGA